ncbi:RNA-binding protein Nova-1-like [Oopsacas minuta]|uniref:RNA-binding protein Nova-1-like n=1 Tax=Oopsacas minuta TaxID=111878 RepID=A0AAV7JYW4_9METZ|nr:RNA-binding protein Nova-1-like [Oopsacas minuta]
MASGEYETKYDPNAFEAKPFEEKNFEQKPFERKRKSGPSFEGEPSKRGFPEKVRGIKFLVPDYAAGAIIGKKGMNITEHKEKFGTLVKMSPGREFFPYTNERVCLIIGNKVEIEQTVACFQHLIALIRKDSDEFERKRKPQDADRKNQIKLLLTNNTAGLIIGKRGETIKSIQEQTETRIMITPFDENLDERVCSIAADIYENTLKATDHILDKVIKDPEGHVSRNLLYSAGGSYDSFGGQRGGFGGGYSGGYGADYGYDYDRRGGYDRYAPSRYGDPSGYGYRADMDPSSSLAGTLYVLDDRDPRCLILGIMEDYVGGIVGRNGATISEIQSISHTHIQISDKDEYIPGTRDRKLTIKGEVGSVAMAYNCICSKVSEFTERHRN